MIVYLLPFDSLKGPNAREQEACLSLMVTPHPSRPAPGTRAPSSHVLGASASEGPPVNLTRQLVCVQGLLACLSSLPSSSRQARLLSKHQFPNLICFHQNVPTLRLLLGFNGEDGLIREVDCPACQRKGVSPPHPRHHLHFRSTSAFPQCWEFQQWRGHWTWR